MSSEQHHHHEPHHPHPHHHGEKREEFHIRVNGKEKVIHKESVDYLFMVILAFPDEPNPETLVCKIMYHGPHHEHGTLAQGQKPVKLEDCMVFDVFPTGRS